MTPAEIEQGRRLVEAATPGPWHAGHLGGEGRCQCRYILDEGHAGGIATVHVDNGTRSIADGGNDCPPAEQAAANMHLIAWAGTNLPALLDAYEAAVAERSAMRRLAVRSALCLSGFVGEGICVDRFEDPSDVYMALAQELGLSEADDEDLRALLSGDAA